MSKANVAGVRVHLRANVRTLAQEILAYSNSEEHKRNFLESVELQVGLKNYDTRKDRRFSGVIHLPTVVRPHLRLCVIGDQYDIDRARHLGIDTVSLDDLEKLNKNKKSIKKLARKYEAFLASISVIRQIPRVLGPGLSHTGRFPIAFSHDDDISAKAKDLASIVKFRLQKPLDLGVTVGHVGMTEDELVENIMLAISFLVSLLKKGWHNVASLNIKATMSPPHRLC